MLTTPPRGGIAAPTEGSANPALAVCPFARDGLAARRMVMCPGFSPQPLSFAGLGAGESLGEATTCCHLGTQRGRRGFVSACRHPGVCPV